MESLRLLKIMFLAQQPVGSKKHQECENNENVARIPHSASGNVDIDGLAQDCGNSIADAL